MDWRRFWNYSDKLVTEDDYDAIRHQLWYYTDSAYKNALENLARKNSSLQANPNTDPIPDFSHVAPETYFEDPIQIKTDKTDWSNRIKLVSEVFEEFDKVQDWHVEYYARSSAKRYVNSEGSKYLTGNVIHIFNISATAQADDGERLTNYLKYYLDQNQDPPTDESIISDVRKLAGYLQEATQSEALDEYVGPVLFEEFASAELISYLFASQLSLPRKMLASEEWYNRMLPVGKLAARVNRRVFPDFVSIIDDPFRKEWNGTTLAGYKQIDAEGVQAEKLTLVEDGWLRTLPLGRLPTKKISKSNGHSIALPNQITIPGITNLLVSSSKPLRQKKLMSKFRKLCKEYGNDYGLIVRQLESSQILRKYQTVDGSSGDEGLLPRPTMVYKYYVADGRIEPVRGLSFDEVSIRSLRDITALGNDVAAYNLAQPTIFSQIAYTASIVVPSILVEEMEFKAASQKEPLPISVNPMFE